MKLVIFERDWADEFSPFGFAIMRPEEYEEFRQAYANPREWYFGTNEGFTAEDDTLEGIKVKDITQVEADRLIELFNVPAYAWNYRSVGLFPPKPEEDMEDN